MTQSSAILRYVGKLTGLYPEDPLLAAQVDEVDQVRYEPTLRYIATFCVLVTMFVWSLRLLQCAVRFPCGSMTAAAHFGSVGVSMC